MMYKKPPVTKSNPEIIATNDYPDSSLSRILPALTEKSKIKNCLLWGLNPQPLDLHSNTIPTELSQHSVASLKLHGLCNIMLY